MQRDQIMEPRVLTNEPSGQRTDSLAYRYEALLSVSRTINSYPDPAALFRALANELQNVVKFDFIGMLLYDESDNKIQMPALDIVSGRRRVTIAFWLKFAPVRVRAVDPGARLAGVTSSMSGTASGGACPNKSEPVRNAHTKKWSRDFMMDSPSCRPLEPFIAACRGIYCHESNCRGDRKEEDWCH